MLSAMGCLGIMLGTFGGLWAWEEQQCAKRNYLQEMYQMFRKGKYALVAVKKAMVSWQRTLLEIRMQFLQFH